MIYTFLDIADLPEYLEHIDWLEENNIEWDFRVDNEGVKIFLYNDIDATAFMVRFGLPLCA